MDTKRTADAEQAWYAYNVPPPTVYLDFRNRSHHGDIHSLVVRTGSDSDAAPPKKTYQIGKPSAPVYPESDVDA